MNNDEITNMTKKYVVRMVAPLGEYDTLDYHFDTKEEATKKFHELRKSANSYFVEMLERKFVARKELDSQACIKVF